MSKKLRIIGILLTVLLVIGLYFYFNYYFTEEQKNMTQRKFDTITGQNLRVTVFDANGRIVKSWAGVKKISTFQDQRNYTFFYTSKDKYVQIPDSVWYIAEEEDE